MTTAQTKSLGIYSLWLCLLTIAFILLPYYLGALVAAKAWYRLSSLLFIFILSVLLVVEARYLILFTTVALLIAGSSITSISGLGLTSRWVFLGALVLKSISQWASKKFQIKIYAFDLWAACFIGLAFYSYSYSFIPSLTVDRSISVLVFYVAVFKGVWGYMDSGEKVNILINDLCKIAFVVLILNLFYLSRGRFSGIFLNPNTLGLFLTLTIPFILWIYLCERKPVPYYFLLLALFSLLLTGSRASMLVCALSSTYLIWLYHQHQKFLILFVVAFAVCIAFFLGSLFDLSWFLDSEFIRWKNIQSGGGRIEAWDAVIGLIKHRPILGYGFGTEEFIFQRFDIIFQEHSGAYAHNSFLGLASQLGLLGTFIFYTPLFLFLFFNTRRLTKLPFKNIHWLAPPLNAVLWGGVLEATFESWMYSAGSPCTFIFWSFLVMAHCLKGLPVHENDRLEKRCCKAAGI